MSAPTEGDQLVAAVRRLFTYLDIVEESEFGRKFHPIHISCCRAMMTEGLEQTLAEMKRLSAEKQP